MSTSVTGVVSHFPSAENGFTTTTSGSVASGALTVGLNSAAGYSNGEVVVFVIDPTDVIKKQTFTGIIDTSGLQVTSVVWTAGTNQLHALGATVVDYATATHISMVSKGLLVAHNQDGTLKTNAVSSAAMLTTGVVTAPKLSTELQKGWLNDINGTTVPVPNTITANGNRSYNLVVNATDLTSSLSPGMRLRTTRTVAAPTQSASLNGTTQWFSNAAPAGMTFTVAYSCTAWVKLNSYGTGQPTIISRTAGTGGFAFDMGTNGILRLYGTAAGVGRQVSPYQSLPLNKWVHVSASIDMAANTGSVYIDGALVPSVMANIGAGATAIVQTGNIEVGSQNAGTNTWPGKIAQAAIHSVVLTAAQVKAIYSQGITTADTTTYNMVSAYSLSGAGGLTDLNTTNNNTLTANGSAVTTNADSPFGGQAGGTVSSTLDYGIIQAISFSTNTTITVQVPEGCTIPTSGGVSALAYSTQKAPYGMPVSKEKWRIKSVHKLQSSQAAAAINTWYNIGSFQIAVPIGDFEMSYQCSIQSNPTGTTAVYRATLSTGAATESDGEMTSGGQNSATGEAGNGMQTYRIKGYTFAIPTTLYFNMEPRTVASQTLFLRGDDVANVLIAENGYL